MLIAELKKIWVETKRNKWDKLTIEARGKVYKLSTNSLARSPGVDRCPLMTKKILRTRLGKIRRREGVYGWVVWCAGGCDKNGRKDIHWDASQGSCWAVLQEKKNIIPIRWHIFVVFSFHLFHSISSWLFSVNNVVSWRYLSTLLSHIVRFRDNSE